ncbi:MAG: thiol-disulfide oxidoreductase DCC family protein [Flavobacteriaceae bacterium]|nr:thiol-disulfide oxidoreductase DCC family protein [Flavobacteriaceae bacterium]
MSLIPSNKKLILFDGVCNLCNNSINFVIKHDKKDLFLFAPLQSETGKALIQQHHIDTEKIDSIILADNEGVLSFKSTAALKIAARLGFPINLAVIFFIIPPFMRNVLYDYVARNRYKWFGRKDKCMIPTPELKAKFLN